ncbi:MAG: type II toxin-antitoxin system prevent-host-death family antitoxin [Kiritimatiellae bacterium]|nr:type II toxin-antitoxin system prevent-host-death family antitoxin [Kiritimatiellia bacterium]
MKTMAVGELKTHFSEVLDEVKHGHPIAIGYGKRKTKVAVIVPYEQYKRDAKRHLIAEEDRATYLADNHTETPTETMVANEYVSLDPGTMLGKPTIRGTRLTVELILRKLAEGATAQELVEAHPQLSAEAIHAAIRYAADTLAHEEQAFATA